jgi:shikimate kinase
MERRNIVLCGFMATGKSSVGKELAALLGYDFLDMDAIIEAEAGMPIPEIFSTRGEPAFREMESRLVERLSKRIGGVIATGGGTIVNRQNFENLKRSGITVALTADPETILMRAGTGENRPMLGKADHLQRIQDLLQQRSAAYSMADFSVDTSNRSISEVAAIIAGRLKKP